MVDHVFQGEGAQLLAGVPGRLDEDRLPVVAQLGDRLADVGESAVSPDLVGAAKKARGYQRRASSLIEDTSMTR